MRLNVNPNRMELSKLKKRLSVASRGHKLLKDKQDELMRRFILLVKKNNELRKKVEQELSTVYKDFVLVGAETSPENVEASIMFPKEKISVLLTTENIMSVNVPKMEFSRETENTGESKSSYGFFQSNNELDLTIENLYQLVPELLALSEIEKTCNLLADEIQKTRRRVNALEYMTIPELEVTIKYIKAKLDETERGNLTRLMKVKSMLESNIS